MVGIKLSLYSVALTHSTSQNIRMTLSRWASTDLYRDADSVTCDTHIPATHTHSHTLLHTHTHTHCCRASAGELLTVVCWQPLLTAVVLLADTRLIDSLLSLAIKYLIGEKIGSTERGRASTGETGLLITWMYLHGGQFWH